MQIFVNFYCFVLFSFFFFGFLFFCLILLLLLLLFFFFFNAVVGKDSKCAERVNMFSSSPM